MERRSVAVNTSLLLAAFLNLTAIDGALAQQDSAFLACAQHTDRAQRIACLEDALEAALGAQESAQPAAQAPAPAATETAPPASPNPVAAVPAPTPAPEAPAEAPSEPEERRSLLDRIRSFGQSDGEASISTDESGNDRLHDTITALEQRGEMWIVTLSSGQVWRQVYPRRLNLRVGDEISIYQEGIGEGYRLATERLSGFIRVERTR